MRLPVTLIVATMTAVLASGQQSAKQIITTGGNPALPFSPAVKAGGLIFVAGTLGTNSSGAIAKGDIKAQTKQTLENISTTLKAAGSSLPNAASAMVYLRSASDFAAMNEVYASYFPKDPPTRTTVIVPQPLANADGLIEISMVAIPAGGERVVVHPSDWIKSPNPYSYGIRTGNTLFLSGLVSRNGKDNTNIKGDITAQTKVVLDNGAAILKAAGMSYADVVSSRVYLPDDSTFQAMNAAYRSYFAAAPPARATVKAGLNSADNAVEITMVAVKDASRTAITTPNADGAPGTPNQNLSSAIRVGNRLFVAGITGNTATNKGDVKAQTTEVLARVGRTLKAAGFEWSNVVDGVVYLPDMTKFQDMNAAYRETFSKDFPARATVGTGLMGADAAVEIMFTAVK
ncbi:MAG TPA: RidA family protein [Vicinamibacterales bacterium]|nr:RidA family protein [Vicinamibacterales bacterium]